MPAPRFITFEGIDGSGKSSHLRRLASRLEERGHELCLVKEPGGTPIGEALRAIILDPELPPPDGLTELLMLFASRRQLLAREIDPALDAGKIVLCDRFTDSTYAYQGGGRGLPPETIDAVDRLSTGRRRPDRTLLFDIDPAEGRARSRSARRRALGFAEGGVDRIDEEALEFYTQVRERYLELAASEPDRFRIIDSSGTREQTEQLVLGSLAELFDRSELAEASRS